jgi:hypothetical protein
MIRRSSFAWTVTLLIALGTFGLARPVLATRFEDFDKLDAIDQAEFVATMVDIADTSLRNASLPGAATRLEEAFATYEPAYLSSEGVARLEVNIDKARKADVDMQQKNPNSYSSRVHVQQAMVWAMEDLNVDVPLPVNNDLFDLLDGPGKPFHPMTYAEFHAQSPDEQRRIIKAYAMTGYLAFLLRDSKTRGFEKSYLGTLYASKMSDEMFEFVRAQFPANGPQPGFTGVVTMMEPGQNGSSTPARPMSAIILFTMHHSEERSDATVKELEARAVMIPDGRLVYPDKGGVFWTLSDNKGIRLEDNLQPLARALRQCMERRRLYAAEGLAACRQEVGIR